MDLERQVQELTKRVDALEAELLASRASTTYDPNVLYPPPTGAPVGFPAAQQPPPPRPNQPVLPGPAVAPVRTTTSFDWGIESVLRWAGVVLVTLAAIFLVSTAISRGWIGPELQLLGAALGGAVLLAAAVHLAESRRPWSLALGCGGAAVLVACSLATHEWLDLVGPGPAVGLLVVATLVSVGVALRIKLEGIALVAAVGAMTAAIETLTSFGDAAVLTWLVAFILGTSALGLSRRWPGVRMITGWIGALILMGHALEEEVEGALQVLGFIGAAVIGTTLWLSPTVAQRVGGTDGSGRWWSFDWTPVDYRLVGFVPLWAWAVVGGLLPIESSQDFGIVAVVTAAGFLALAEATYDRVPRPVSVTTFLGAFTVLAIGFSLVFDGPILMVALAGQAAASFVLGRRLDDTPLEVAGYIAGAASTMLAIIEMGEAIDLDGFTTVGGGLATLMVVACWVGAAVLARQRAGDIPFEVPFIGAWAGSMLWLAAVFIGVPQGQMLISAAWAAMACAGLIIGLTQRIGVVKNLALATLALTLAKLVTVDLSEVDVFWRVGLFFVVGSGLIALGLKVPSLMGPEPEDEPEVEPEREPGRVETF